MPALLAVVLAIAVAVFAVWPAPVIPDAVVGHWNHPDTLGNHWAAAWVADGVLEGRSILHNQAYYWPVGDYPLVGGGANEGFLLVPFQALVGWPWSVSLYSLCLLVANGLAAWWGARRAGASEAGALVAAAAFGANPYVLQELGSGRLSQADTVFLALALGWGVGVCRDLIEGRPPHWTSGLLGGVLCGVTAVLYWYYGYFLAIAAVAMAVPAVVAARVFPWRLGVAAVGAAVAVAVGPLAWHLSQWHLVPGGGEVGAFPHPEAFGDAVGVAFPVRVLGPHAGAAVSVVVLALVVGLAVARIAAWWRRGERPPGVEVAVSCLVVVGVLLARGPSFPALYDAVYFWPTPLRRFWWPSRHLVLVHWGLAVLGARGLTSLTGRWSEARAVTIGFVAALAVPGTVWLAGDLARVPVSRYEAPALYAALADLPAGAVAEVPFAPWLGGTPQSLAYQRTHGKPLLGGHAMWVDRVRPRAWDARLQDNSFLAGWVAFERGEARTVRFRAEDLEALRREGLRWIVRNPELVPRRALDSYAVLEDLFGAPVVEADGGAVFDLEGWTGVTEVRPPPYRLGAGTAIGNGERPFMGERAPSLGLSMIRDATRPFQGLLPTGPGPRPGQKTRP